MCGIGRACLHPDLTSTDKLTLTASESAVELASPWSGREYDLSCATENYRVQHDSKQQQLHGARFQCCH